MMNPNIPLDIFIPPKPEFDYVNVLATNDRHGLNNGCFLIRINPWSVKLLSAVIAFHTFKPDVELKYSEQSALEEMIEDVSYPPALNMKHSLTCGLELLEAVGSPCSPILVQCVSSFNNPG